MQSTTFVPLSRAALLAVLTTIQNGPTFAHQDVVSFAGLCSRDEVAEHILSCFGALPPAEKLAALNTLRARLAPPSD